MSGRTFFKVCSPISLVRQPWSDLTIFLNRRLHFTAILLSPSKDMMRRSQGNTQISIT